MNESQGHPPRGDWRKSQNGLLMDKDGKKKRKLAIMGETSSQSLDGGRKKTRGQGGSKSEESFAISVG